MAFFERSARRAPLPPPPWRAPPVYAVGSAVPLQRLLVRTDSLVVALTRVVAFPSGCQFDLRVAARASVPDRADRRRLRAAFLGDDSDLSELGRPDEPFRCGIRFADGTTVTSVDPAPWWDPTSPMWPEAPVLVEYGSLGTHIEADRLWCGPGYWLWPLPPPKPFTLVVDWPAAGIPQTEVELDGAAIAAAGEAAELLWPDDAHRD
jgi:hypothetical protein